MKIQTPTDALLTLAAASFEAWSAVLFCRQPGKESAAVAASVSRGLELDRNTVVEPGKGLVGYILRNKKPLVMNNSSSIHLPYYHASNMPPIRSFIGHPVAGGGVLCVDSLDPAAFPQAKQDLLRLFAEIIPRFADMQEPDCEDNPYLAVLDRIRQNRLTGAGWSRYMQRFFTEILAAAGMVYGAFVSSSGKKYFVETDFPPVPDVAGQLSVSVYSDIIGWVVRNGQPVIHTGSSGTIAVYSNTKFKRDFMSYACMPVSMGDEICGALFVGSMAQIPIGGDARIFLQLAAEELSRELESISRRQRRRF